MTGGGALEPVELATRINEVHVRCEAAARSTLKHAVEAGRLVREVVTW